jgi:hypothetical protein
MIDDLLAYIIGPSTDFARAQAALPVRSGGLGLPMAVAMADICYIASAAQTLSTQRAITRLSTSYPPNLAAALYRFNLQLPSSKQLTLERLVVDRIRQRDLTSIIIPARFESLLSQSSCEDAARLLSVSAPHATDYLHVLPIKVLGLSMPTGIFRSCLRMQLGLPIFEPGLICPCCKSAPLTTSHALTCSNNGDRISRHNNLRDILFELCRRGGLLPKLEPNGVFGHKTGQKPDISVPCWSGSRTAAFDVGVTCPTKISSVEAAAVRRFAAAEGYRATKVRKFSSVCGGSTSSDLIFIPLIVETYGAWDPRAHSALCRIASHVASVSGREFSDVKRNMYQRLSFSLMRNNAAMIQDRLPDQADDTDLPPPLLYTR